MKKMMLALLALVAVGISAHGHQKDEIYLHPVGDVEIVLHTHEPCEYCSVPGDVWPCTLDETTAPPTCWVEGDGVLRVMDVVTTLRASVSIWILKCPEPTDDT